MSLISWCLFTTYIQENVVEWKLHALISLLRCLHWMNKCWKVFLVFMYTALLSWNCETKCFTKWVISHRFQFLQPHLLLIQHEISDSSSAQSLHVIWLLFKDCSEVKDGRLPLTQQSIASCSLQKRIYCSTA